MHKARESEMTAEELAAAVKAWRGKVPAREAAERLGMVAAPLFMDERNGMMLVSGASAKQEDGTEVLLSWWDQPHNRRWKDGGDAKKERRMSVVRELVNRFHGAGWRD